MSELSLKAEGFAELVASVADRARQALTTRDIVRVALTLDDRLAEDVGRRALTAADRVVVDGIVAGGGTVDPDGDDGDRLYLTTTGRLVARMGDAAGLDGGHLLGALRWATAETETGTKAAALVEAAATAAELAAVHAELAGEPVERVRERIDRIEYSLVHMAPVLLHVDDQLFSNLGKTGELPGKSLGVEDGRSLLNRLRALPVARWTPEEACFVACLNAVLLSGPPVRAEEFNGIQLIPSTVAAFLTERIAAYGGPRHDAALPGLAGLEARATECGALRERVVGAGLTPYRVINGLVLHKVEHLMAAPTLLTDVPPEVRDHVRGLLGVRLPAGLADLAPNWAELAEQLTGTAAADPFTTAFEAVLHGLLTAIAEAFDADVSMSRGPQRFDPLCVDHGAADPLGLGTGDFYCCVTPRRAFTERFGGNRAALAKTLAAYSARMRFNTWHYLPHTLGIVEREPGRDDWFFAPTMADVTEWSDQHHTGHVVFGVRYAIRVPFGIEYDGRLLPGLYDLRLMRTSAPAFTVPDLRAAIATSMLLQGYYQAMSVHQPTVTDFGRDWYQRVHG